MLLKLKYKNTTLESVCLFLLSFFILTSIISIIIQTLNHYHLVEFTTSAVIFALLICSVMFLLTTSGHKSLITIPLFFVVLSFVISGYFPDASYDSLAYHEQAVWFVMNGGDLIYDFSPQMNKWVAAYPKATWLFSGELSKLTGSLKGTQCYQLIIAFSLLFYSLNFALNSEVKKYAAIAFSVLLTLSPVLIAQLFSFYVDATIGLLGLLSIFSSVAFAKTRRWIDGVVLVLSCIGAVNIKFTGFIYVAVAFLYIGVFSLPSIKKVTTVFLMFFSFLFVGVCLIGNNPYIQNIIAGKNIFHPLFGEGAIDIMTAQYPASFSSMNRFEKLYVSMFSRSGNIYLASNELPKLKIPGTIMEGEINSLSSEDLRIGGFGPLFSIALILSIIFILFKKGISRDVLCLLSLIILNTILNPEAWWARYAPQIYAIPLLAIFACNKNNQRDNNLPYVSIIILYLIYNAFLLISTRYEASKTLHVAFQHLSSNCRSIEATPYNNYLIEPLLSRYEFNYKITTNHDKQENFRGIFSYKCL